MTPLKKVLFVCTGNTCRSPMAEGIFMALARSFPQWKSASAGTSAGEGWRASRETIDILKHYGVDFTSHVSQPINGELIEQATNIFTMTHGHLEFLRVNFPEHSEKMSMLTELTTGMDVPDPIGCGKHAYEQVAVVLEESITSIIHDFSKS